MNNSLLATFCGTFAGVIGTALGGVIGCILFYFGKKYRESHKLDKNLVYSLLYEFSSGLMMAVVTFHMIPEAIKTGGMSNSLIGLFLGLLFIFIIKKIMENGKNQKIMTGMLILFGIALHNFPEGIAIGASFSSNIALSMSLIFVIAIHDIPEGISIFIPLYAGGMKLKKILILIALSGLPTGLGAFVGELIGEMGSNYISMSLGFAAGAMLYICVGELSFEARDLCNRKLISIGYIIGLVLGLIII